MVSGCLPFFYVDFLGFQVTDFEVGSGCSPMVELQSCATLVNASALCAIEQEVQGDGVNAIAEISAELQRERQKNEELMERISMLEAQIQERDGHVRLPSFYLYFCLDSWFAFSFYHYCFISVSDSINSASVNTSIALNVLLE